MPSLPQRLRKLQSKLLEIRLGPGAVVLPQEVKRIHLRFAPRMNGGHMGARKFWRHELIRLKYHNPAVPMTIDRNVPQDGESTLSVHFASYADADSSPTGSPAPIQSTSGDVESSQYGATERVESIDMKNRTNGQILDELIRVTRAYPIEPTEADKEELRALQDQSVRSAEDRKTSLEARARVRRERELLEQAKGEMASA